jgi:lactate dehydrogenase-like 2-hydroxyacid dehydrogenase
LRAQAARGGLTRGWYDEIDAPAATERGVQVVCTPCANTESGAEPTIDMMIGLSKDFTQQLAARLARRPIGTIGFGRIGRRVGEIARVGFSMKVLDNDVVPARSGNRGENGCAPSRARRIAGSRRVHDLARITRRIT